MSCAMIGVLMILASIARSCTGCPFCTRQQQLQQLQQQRSQLQQQQQFYRTIGSPRPFGADRPSRVQEFNRTGVLHPEYQIPATIRPGNVSQFYYLSPREGPPLTLLVSPCSGPISWTVSYVEPPGNDQDAEGIKCIANAMACEDPKAGIASFHIRGRGGPKFHDTKDAGRSLLVRDQVHGARGTVARHGAPVRDLQRPGSHIGHVRQRKGASASHAEISTATKQTTADDILEQEPCGSSPFELLFSCHFGYAAASVDTLRRAEHSESLSFGENRLFLEGAPSSGRSGRSALRAADQADASQDEIRHYVQLYPIRGKHPEQRLQSCRHQRYKVQEDAGADIANRSLHHGQSAEDRRFRQLPLSPTGQHFKHLSHTALRWRHREGEIKRRRNTTGKGGGRIRLVARTSSSPR